MIDSASRYVSQIIRVTPVEKSGAFDKALAEDSAFPYGAEIKEGISEPFSLKLTLLSGSQFSSSDLKNVLKRKYTVEIFQRNEAQLPLRSRKLEGIITSYRMTGRVVSNQLGLDDCYCYEFTLEPEIVLLGLDKKTRSWCGYSVGEIIEKIFEDSSLNVSFEKELMAGDSLSSKSFIFEQFEESDFDFINRLCVRFSLNYTFGYVDEKQDKFSAIFSRGFQIFSHYPVLVKDKAVSAKDSLDVSVNNKILLIDEKYTVQNCIYSVSGMQDSIYSEKSVSYGSELFSSDLNDDISANEKQKKYLEQSNECVKNFNEDCVLSYASDLIFVPGANLKYDCSHLGVPDTTYIIAKSFLNFTTDYPKGLASSDELISRENKVEQCFVSIKTPQNSDSSVLGSVSQLNLEDFSLPEKKFILSQKNRSSNRHTEKGSFRIVNGVVCDRDGNISSTDESLRIPSIADRGLYNCFYVRVKNALTPVICKNVIRQGTQSSGNIPLIGQNVSMFFNGNCYYLNGLLPNSGAVGVNDQKFDDYKSQSLYLLSDKKHDGVSINPSCSLETRIKDLLIKGELNTLIDNLDCANDTPAISDFYHNSNISFSYKSITSEENSSYSQSERNEMKSFAQWADFIPSLLAESQDYLVKISERIKIKELNNEVSEQDLEDLSTAKSVLADTYSLIDLYSKSLGSQLESVSSIDDSGSCVTIKGQSINLNAMSSDNTSVPSAISVSAESGISIKSFNNDVNTSDTKYDKDISKKRKVTIEAAGAIDIKSANKIKLSVANNSIVIDSSGISINANMYPYKNTICSSNLSLTTLGGFSAKAMDMNLMATSSVSLGDSYSAQLAMSAGQTVLRGASVMVASTTKWDLAGAVTNFVKRIPTLITSVTECIQVNSEKDKGNNADQSKIDSYLLKGDNGNKIACDTIDIAGAIYDVAQSISKANANDGMQKYLHAVKAYLAVIKLLNLIEDIVNSTFMIAGGADNVYSCREDMEKMSNRDITQLTFSIMSRLGYWAQAIPLLVSICRSSVGSSMMINADGIQEKSAQKVAFHGLVSEGCTESTKVNVNPTTTEDNGAVDNNSNEGESTTKTTPENDPNEGNKNTSSGEHNGENDTSSPNGQSEGNDTPVAANTHNGVDNSQPKTKDNTQSKPTEDHVPHDDADN